MIFENNKPLKLAMGMDFVPGEIMILYLHKPKFLDKKKEEKAKLGIMIQKKFIHHNDGN